MKIIIVGAGKIGGAVADQLSAEGHEITVIDNDEQTIYSISNRLDVICVNGDATDLYSLKEAGADSADLLIAATEKDETNMICGIAAGKLGTKHVVARIRDPKYLGQTDFLREAFGLNFTINPDYACAEEIARILKFPSASHVDNFSRGKLEIVEYAVPDSGFLCGKKLTELHAVFGSKILVTVVDRNGEAIIPDGSFEIRGGDRLSIVGTASDIRNFFITTRDFKRPVKKVMIMGGSRLAVYLTGMLEESGITVSVSDRNRERCDELTELLPKTEIIYGDATDTEVLSEEGIGSCDAFVTLTGDDGDNITVSLYAKSRGINTIITKVTGENLVSMVRNLGLDSVVTPSAIISEQITAYVRAVANSQDSDVEALYYLADGKVEALELSVEADAECIGVPLKDLSLKKNLLIAAIIRGDKSITPNGNTEILPGDHAVIITTNKGIHSINEILEK